ncbi:Trk system potassium uptake protein trkA [uncultured Clostridium sp.]|nr:Trk system potassium uptake protein trkA [uncultured Clostridium sp.]
MKIVIVGGRKKTEFLLKSLLNKKHKVSVVNKDYEYCKFLSENYNCDVICGDGSKSYILEESGIKSCDVLIAITSKDASNLTICKLAKNIYNVKKVFSVVSNPQNVEVFKLLGVNDVISATYIVSDIIEQMAMVDDIYNFIPINNSKINILEIGVKDSYNICNKYIREINLPQKSIIGCIIRGSNSIIPNGSTKIIPYDKLIILCDENIQDDVIKNVSEGK